mmetsp:Transcript_15710/g.31255  ORF Transcript_15710/g.31255 Transcript_15710/m.31255 type:complete len:205 (-) Transcript_15710:451-1065(-)
MRSATLTSHLALSSLHPSSTAPTVTPFCLASLSASSTLLSMARLLAPLATALMSAPLRPRGTWRMAAATAEETDLPPSNVNLRQRAARTAPLFSSPSAKPKYTSLSNLPGLSKLGSSRSGLFVAAITNTPPPPPSSPPSPTPSSSASSMLTTLSMTPPESPVPSLLGASESSSSKKSTALPPPFFAARLASSKTFLTLASLPPT